MFVCYGSFTIVLSGFLYVCVLTDSYIFFTGRLAVSV